MENAAIRIATGLIYLIDTKGGVFLFLMFAVAIIGNYADIRDRLFDDVKGPVKLVFASLGFLLGFGFVLIVAGTVLVELFG